MDKDPENVAKCCMPCQPEQVLLIWGYGLPEQIVADNGFQFTSEETESLVKQNGIGIPDVCHTTLQSMELYNVSIRPLNMQTLSASE